MVEGQRLKGAYKRRRICKFLKSNIIQSVNTYIMYQASFLKCYSRYILIYFYSLRKFNNIANNYYGLR